MSQRISVVLTRIQQPAVSVPQLALQAGFVDEPRSSVEKADQLVASVIQKLAQVFADERSKLESNWSKGGEVSTEDLRQALRRYRSFFDRLLSV